MAQITGVKIGFDLRPCLIGAKKVKGLFHKWYEDPHAGIVGIIEYEDGHVAKVTPKNIQFLDSASKFASYWGDETEDGEARLRKAEVNDGK